MSYPASEAGRRPAVITGGAGFLGSNLAERLLAAGRDVILLDNLSRPGSEVNLTWLRERRGNKPREIIADVRDERAVADVIAGASAVFHFAAQVAVTTSIERPAEDFDVNARGTLNVLEAARRSPSRPALIFTSTNKVYGDLADILVAPVGTRYMPVSAELRESGVSEERPLCFHSPYGCSKGAADQYVLDYARTYGLRAAALRMSCIYGPRQLGTEDQGWVAHFLLRAAAGAPITLYGNGLQVRDVLFVDDLIDAMLAAEAGMSSIAGRAFNIGGGPSNTTSLLELVALIGEIRGAAPEIAFGEWRQGDQRFYVSDVRAFGRATGWRPTVPVRRGVELLHQWLAPSRAQPAAASTLTAGAP